MVLQHNLDKFHAMEYGSVIADAFITRYRSSYDSIGWAFKELANQPGSISPKFKELRDAYKEDEDEFVKNLGEDLANLIKFCDWFDQIKDVRDAIIHYDFNTSGFMASRILFQVSKWSKNGGFVNKINLQGAMINENLVDFELYAGVHMGYSLWFLEELARIGYHTLKIERFPDIEPKKYHDGFEPLNGWILRVLAERPLS